VAEDEGAGGAIVGDITEYPMFGGEAKYDSLPAKSKSKEEAKDNIDEA
jgi:hypothetical protein